MIFIFILEALFLVQYTTLIILNHLYVYKTILNNYKFNKVNLIAKDKTNKIVDVLLNNFKFIIFKEKSLKEDIAY